MRYQELLDETIWVTDPMSDPNFRKWFGNSVVRDESGKPLRVYHGTFGNFEAFSNKEGLGGMVFFSVDPKFASGYAASQTGGGGRVIPCYLCIEKLYDFRTPRCQDLAASFWTHRGGYLDRGPDPLDSFTNHQIRVALYGRSDVEDEHNPDISEGRLTYDEWMTAIRGGMYPALECYQFIDWIKNRLKFDGVLLLEMDCVNYGVFSRNQIKSAISNSGEFSRRNPKIGA